MKKSLLQKFLQTMLLVALICMPWVTWSQGYSFTCDFENDADTAAWDFANGDATNQWYIGTAVNHGGTRSLYISNDGIVHEYSGSISSVYAYQTLTLEAGNYEFSYDWICDGESSFDYLRVALAPATTNFIAGNSMGINTQVIPLDWISLDGDNKLNLSTEWTTKSGTFIIPEEGSYKLVFYWHNDGSGQHQPPAAVDNIEIVLPTCPAPIGLVVSNIKSDSATVSWDLTGAASEWEVECVPAGEEPGTGLSIAYTVTEPRCVFSDLTPMTDYVVYVKGNCGSEYSRNASIEFTTACGAVSLPYQDGFETAEHYGLPICWTELSGSSSVYTNSTYNPITSYGQQYLSMSEGARIATPYIEEPLNSLAIDFALKMYDYQAGDLEVSVVTDLNMLENVVAVDTIQLPDGLMHDFDLDLSSIDIAEGGYIIFRQVNNLSDYSSLYLDNVWIRVMSNCHRPQTITATHVNHNSATLRWPVVEGSLGYDVVYGTSDDVDAEDNVTVEYITENTLDITDLIPTTTYYVWVRNICGDEYSEWRMGESFTTQLACAKVINVEVSSVSATGIALNWQFDNSVGIPATQAEVSWKKSTETDYYSLLTDNNYVILQDLEPSTAYTIRIRTICETDTAQYYTKTVSTDINGVTVGDGSYTLSNVPLSTNYKFCYSQMLYPADDLEGIDNIVGISFNAQGSAYTPRHVNVYMGHTMRDTLTSTSYVTIDSLTLVASDATVAVDYGWNSIALTTPFVYNSDSNLVIVIDDNTNSYNSSVSFYAHPGVSVAARRDDSDIDPIALPNLTAYKYVPNIIIETPYVVGACEAPLLTVGNFTATSAQVVWNSGNEGESWQVEYKLSNEEEWTVFDYTTYDTIVTIADLQPGSFYDFRVGTNCPDSILYSNVVTGFTQCAAVSVPYFEDFSSAQRNPCWVYGHATSTDKPYVSMESLYMCFSAGGYAILPEFVDDIASLHVMFAMKSAEDNAQIVVAVGSDPMDRESFVAIDTFAVSDINVYQQQECSFANYEGSGHYIAFYTIGKKIYLDDILVEVLPACGYPSAVSVTDVLSDAATISWSGSTSSTTGWLITYKTATAQLYDTIEVSAEQNGYTLTDLVPNTSYEVIISNLCGTDTVAALNSVSFRTECSPITLPYTENFENESLYTYPTCWHTTAYHSYGSDYDDRTAPEINTDNLEHGKVLKFGDNCNIITPRVPVEANTIKVMFDAMADDIDYTGQLAIGFTTTPNDISNAIYVDTIEFNNIRWNHYDISFTSLETTEEGYIVFRNINNTFEWGEYFEEFYDGYIDNVTIMVDNGCPVVSDVAVSNITSNSAEITFTDASASGSYSIGYSTVNDGNNIPNIVECTTTNYILTGLEQGTCYYVWVRNDCSQGSSLWTAGPNFVTNCTAMNTLPYEENFDSYTTDVPTSVTAPTTYPNHAMPRCWSFLNMSETKSTYPQSFMCNSATLKYADSAACLMMLSSFNTPFFAVLPEFTTPVNELQISFTYCNEGISESNGTLALGVLTDPSDTATFTVIQEYPQSNVVTAITHSFVNDNLVAGGNYRIALRYTGGSRNNYFLGIDNVVVDFAADCAAPEMLSVVAVNANNASITWSGAASSYNVQYRESDATEWTDGPTPSVAAVTIANLRTQTEYQVRIQSNCGTSLSDWSSIVTFTTPCGVVEIPYTENFDSYIDDISSSNSSPSSYPNHVLPNCWSFPVLGSPSPKIFLSDQSRYVVSGNCLFFTSNPSQYSYAVLPALAADLDTLQIEFAYCNESTTSGNGTLTLGVMTNPEDVNTFIALQECPINNLISFVEHNFSTDDTLQDGVSYYIAFRYGDGGTNYYLGLDNISVNYIASCPRPNDPTLVSVTDVEASISWAGNSSNYEVSYKSSTDEDWTIMPIITSNNITITGLSATTEYSARVRAICGVGDTSLWSHVVVFTTDCGAASLPFSEDFSSIYSIDDLECWNSYTGILSNIQNNTEELVPANSYVWTFSSSYQLADYGRNAVINIWGTGTKGWLVTPAINLTTSASLEFDLGRRAYNATLDADDQFSVLISNDNGETWTALHTWPGTSFDQIPSYTDDPIHEVYSLSQYTGDVVRIAFYGESTVSGGDNYMFVDNVLVHATTAPEPICDVPTALAVNNITEMGAELTWNGEATAYDVEYRVQNTETWISDQAVTTSFILTGLQSATTYDWRVRANCGETQSDWVTSTFTTLIPAPTCDEPTALAVNNITETGAELTWNGIASAYDVEYKVQSATTWITVSATTTSYTLTGLQSATVYDWRVRANCGESTSDWVTNTFTTLALVPTCDAPTALAAINITETGAELTWHGTASIYDVEYRVQNTEEWTSDQAISTSYTLTGLQSSTAYDWRVRANCGDVQSDWVTNSFTTLTPTPTCDVPIALTANVTEQSVTIDWIAAEGQSSWEINLTAEDIDDINQIVSVHPVTITDLAPATYTVKVRALCAAELYSNWSESVEFTIDEVEEPECESVSDVVVNNITETSATISWTPSEDQFSWEVVYGEAGFDYTVAEAIAVSTTEYEITNLTENTRYDVYVRAVCDEDFYSEWSEKLTFQTLETTPEGIDGVEGNFQFSIYPNPTHNAITISLSGVDGKVTISVVDMNGRYITTEIIECGNDCEKRMDVSCLAQGTYFVRVLGDNINSVRKLIVR